MKANMNVIIYRLNEDGERMKSHEGFSRVTGIKTDIDCSVKIMRGSEVLHIVDKEREELEVLFF